MKLKIIASLVLILCAPIFAAAAVNAQLVTDEAEAVLAILTKRKTGEPITHADWQRVFQSEGYVRLKKRETSMQRSFADADFKTFVLSDQMAARAQALAETLARWRKADVTRAARLALAYLPKDAHIRARIYPVIKPRDNSFVFDVKTDPAIFLYLDPAVSREKFENTLAHELHHIGYGSTCPRKDVAARIETLTPNAQRVIGWTGAFGEGFAMLAAAGGPNVHPHTVSSAEERARWDKDVANFNDDLKQVDTFFTEILGNKLTADQIQAKGFSFFGVQGPWYTVGWRMSVLIEKTYGRAKLIECMCDQRQLLSTYNRAATKYNRRTRQPLALWSSAITNMRGALVIYGENPAARQKLRQRAQRAKNYAVNVLGLESRRLLIIDGGYRNESVTELHRYTFAGMVSRMIFFPEKDPSLAQSRPKVEAKKRLEFKINPFADLYFYVYRYSSGTEKPPDIEGLAQAVEIARQTPIVLTLVDQIAFELENATAAEAAFKQFPETYKTSKGETVALREKVVAFGRSLVAFEKSFNQNVWPQHKSRLEEAAGKLERTLGPKEQEAFAYFTSHLGMADAATTVPIYLVVDTPWPGGFTMWGKDKTRGACAISIATFDGPQLFTVVLHEAIHALDLETKGSGNVLVELRDRLLKAGFKEDDPAVRHGPHLLVFIQSSETVRRLLDPSFQPYTEGVFTRPALQPLVKVELPIWTAYLDGKITRQQALDQMVDAFVKGRKP